MKKILIILIIAIIIIFSAVLLLNNTVNQQASVSTPVPTPTTASTSISPTITGDMSYCTLQDLQSVVELSPGAGNIYGDLSIKNISNAPCAITGNNPIVPGYDPMIKNISSANIGQAENAVIQLAPGQTVYSQVHYPNGPQCSGPTKSVGVTFYYAVSSQAKVIFSDATGNTVQNVAACTSSTDITTIQVWNLSTQPITQ